MPRVCVCVCVCVCGDGFRQVSPLPTLDSTCLLAHAAVRAAIGEAPLPARRGGPHVD